MTTAMKLSKAAFKHIESEIYYYNDTLKEIARLRKEIMLGGSQSDESGVRSTEVGRPTERIATRLLTHKRLRNLEEMTEAIESAYNTLSDDHQKVIRTKYWSKKRLNWDDVSIQCNMHRNTAMKLRKDMVYLVAEMVGWK
jgi:RinA family phage transcriptional activator